MPIPLEPDLQPVALAAMAARPQRIRAQVAKAALVVPQRALVPAVQQMVGLVVLVEPVRMELADLAELAAIQVRPLPKPPALVALAVLDL